MASRSRGSDFYAAARYVCVLLYLNRSIIIYVIKNREISLTPPTSSEKFTDFSKFLRIFLKGNVTKIRVSVNQVKIYKFFQDFARILVEKTRTTRIAFKKIFVKLDLVFPVHFLGQFVPFGNKQTYIEWACFSREVPSRTTVHRAPRAHQKPVRHGDQ